MKAPSIWLVLFTAVLARATWFLVALHHPSSDDVQYALMAEAIRHREAFPLVAWGIGYGGTITSSWALAGLFALFGPSLATALAYGAVLSLIQVGLWMKIAKTLHPGSEGWVGLLLAAPSAHMGIMMQQLSYADALVVGALVVGCAAKWSRQKSVSTKQSLVLGVLAGYLLYTHPIPSVFAAAILVLWRTRVRVAWAALCAGLFAGVSPLILANLLMRGVTIRRVGARMLNMNASQFSANADVGRLAFRLIEQCVIGIKAQPRLIAESFSSEWGLSVLGIAATAGLFVLLAWSRQSSLRVRWLAWPVIAATLAGNVVFGQNARARFLMPAYASSALLAGIGASLGGVPAQWVAVSVAGLNSFGSWQRVRASGQTVPYSAAIGYLLERGQVFGYADFWQSIPLTFLSQGRLQVASTATDANGFWDRTGHITRRVDAARDVFYVFDASSKSQQPFIQAFESLIKQTALSCETADIPPLRIYSRLSRPVRPQELDKVYQAMGFAASGAGS